MGSGKDIGQDKPAFGWELEPLEPLVLFWVVSLRRKIQDTKECEQHAMAMRPGILIAVGPYAYAYGTCRVLWESCFL